MTRRVSLLLICWLLASCMGGEDKDADTDDAGVVCNAGEGLFYPLEGGAWWRYRVTDPKTEVTEEKVVFTCPSGEVPLKDQITGYPMLSSREDAYGHRWQEVLESGDIVRHVDEWFDAETHARTVVEIFCPHKHRVDDGEHACEGAAWTESHQALAIHATDWDECLGFVSQNLEPETCEIPSTLEIPDGCELEWEIDSRELAIEAAYAEISVTAGDFAALRVRKDGDCTRWWARGVGKVKEVTEGVEEEILLEACLPSNGCDDPPPGGLDEMMALCP